MRLEKHMLQELSNYGLAVSWLGEVVVGVFNRPQVHSQMIQLPLHYESAELLQ